MSRIIIYPYKFGSASARALAENVRARGYSCLRVHPDRKYSRKTTDIVFNWGNHTVPSWDASDMINSVDNVIQAGNKLAAFAIMANAGVPIPEYTTDSSLANAWLEHDGKVVERQLLNASGGRGIVLHTWGKSKRVNDAPLYTRYFKKLREYRVHVANGDVIDWQQKMTRQGESENVDYQIRNHDNGWIFARDAAEPIPNSLLDMAASAVNCLGLHFGAVDLGWNHKYGQGVVFEVNTAPGLAGEQTLNSYTDFIIDHYEDRT